MIYESRNPMMKTARAASVWGIVFLCSVGHVCLPSSSTFADTASPRRDLGPWAQGLRVRPGMDASGRILRGCTFIGLDLRHAKFDGADLNGCKIYQCDLRNASFKNAIFSGLQWGHCDLEGAVLDDGVLNDVQPIGSVSGYGIQFTAAQFVSTRSYKTKNMSNCIVAIALDNGEIVPHKFDFRNADLRGTVFASCDLRQCDFTGATIDGMGMHGGAILFEQLAATKNYAKGNLCGTGFGGVTVSDPWKLTGLDLTGARFNGAGLLENADLRDAVIRDCSFRCSIDPKKISTTRSYRTGDLSQLELWHMNLEGLDLSGQCLAGCHFHQCDFTGVSLDDAVISSARFRDCRITVDQIKTTWNFRHGRMTGIVLPEIIADALE